MNFLIKKLPQTFFFVLLGLAMGQVIAAEKTAIYRITFENLWNEVDHLGFPGNAHFSNIVTVNHNNDYRLFALGEVATSGMEDLAELGATRKITREINEQIDLGLVEQLILADALFPRRDGPSLSFEIEASKEFPFLSFATMIAPSPDWIVGIDSLELFQDGEFIESHFEELFAINAGTESGDFGGNFSLRNAATDPIEEMSFLEGNGFEKPFARVFIERIR